MLFVLWVSWDGNGGIRGWRAVMLRCTGIICWLVNVGVLVGGGVLHYILNNKTHFQENILLLVPIIKTKNIIPTSSTITEPKHN